MAARGAPVSKRQRPADKQTRKLKRQLERAGLRVTLGGNGHWKVYDGERYLLTFAGTSADNMQTRHVRRDLRRYHGIELEEQ
ncbi:hypothetical protein ARBITER_69 [Mycobacterium phage Arbiter]|uniref:HicA-like toxin n=2 Tax=Rosebushvirus TaxID=1982900 RepID=S5VZ83_9CAUD|nr:hypothetical protein FPF50_gp75 [Mycobacterium phage TA17A]AEN79572.1 hypothetical protein ARBITER_69 [Mycobacterium phage Arbiter]AGS81484.1 hypothetical protein TA17A_75 [Mycobacterium phage TA17A]